MMEFFKAVWTQYFPPAPSLTEESVASQVGRVFIVTGSNQGIGYELVKMLYPSGATIYMACRSEERARKAMDKIKSTTLTPKTPATLKYLHLDLADLTAVKASAATFAVQETKLDILWNNAGVGGAPVGTTTQQNIEGHVGTNCIAPLLFTQLLLPQLQIAAKSTGTARVVWTSSLMTETHAIKGGLAYPSLETGATTNPMTDYASSKVGNVFLCSEMARRHGPDGIISIVQNPGNIETNITAQTTLPWFVLALLKLTILYEPRYGGYTLLYAGFTDDITATNNGAYIVPFGRVVAQHARVDINQAISDGKAKEFWEWCETKFAPYV